MPPDPRQALATWLEVFVAMSRLCANIHLGQKLSEFETTQASDPARRARAWFAEQGVSITEWAMQRGFAPALVHAVLKGDRKCVRGQSFRIAVALGIKPAPQARELVQ